MITNYKEELKQIQEMHSGIDKAKKISRIVDLLSNEWSNSTAGYCLPFCQYVEISEEEYEKILENEYDRLPKETMEKLEKLAAAADTVNRFNDRSKQERELERLADIARHVQSQILALDLLQANQDNLEDELSEDIIRSYFLGIEQQLADMADRLDRIDIQ